MDDLKKSDDILDFILATMAKRLELDNTALETLRVRGRLDAFTAVDSLLMVELVLMLEERFDIRFDPENIDAALISDLKRLVSFVAQSRAVS